MHRRRRAPNGAVATARAVARPTVQIPCNGSLSRIEQAEIVTASFHERLAMLRSMLVPVLLCSVVTAPLHAGAKTVKVFILAGQSNMEGKAPNALLEHQAKDPKTKDLFAHLRKDDKWIVRDDV